MRRIGEVGNRELACIQTGCRRPEYELWAADEAVATLRWQGDSLAVAETAEGRWSFERPGFRRSRVSVREVVGHRDRDLRLRLDRRRHVGDVVGRALPLVRRELLALAVGMAEDRRNTTRAIRKQAGPGQDRGSGGDRKGSP